MYELCTSGGFSGPTRHFRPLKALQLTDSAFLKVIVVRAHAGEPPLIFSHLAISVYELCTDAELTSRPTAALFACVYDLSIDSTFIEP